MQVFPLSICNIDLLIFDRIQLIKQGRCGCIYKVREKRTNKYFVAKTLEFAGCDDGTKEKNINHEIEILMSVNNPTLIKIYGFSRFSFQNSPNITLIMDRYEKGSLHDVLDLLHKSLLDINYTETTRQKLLIGISWGMKYLHDRGIIHRDLSTNNILIDDNYQPVITDFGLSKFSNPKDPFNQSFYGGTIQYTAPEVLQFKPYDSKADVYSFGIIMHEIVIDLEAYPDLHENPKEFNEKVVKENYRPQFTLPIKKSLKNIITQCWSPDPAKRPTFNEIFEKVSDIKSMINKDENGCFIDGINDIDDIQDYIESITAVKDPIIEYDKNLRKIRKQNSKLSQNLIKKCSQALKWKITYFFKKCFY